MSISRRKFIRASAGISAAMSPGFFLGESSHTIAESPAKPRLSAGPRPNVLYIIMEDIGPQLACYGEPLVKTPTVDRLAAEGVRFTSAYSSSPVCSPSRSALMTGNYQTSINAQQHRTWEWHKQPLPNPIRHISEWFREAGYYTCNLQPKNTDGTAKEALHGAAGSGKVDLNFHLAGAQSTHFFDGSDWRERAPGQPFFAHITIIETHKGQGWTAARQQPANELVDPSKVKLQSFYPDSSVARDEYANYLDAIHLSDGYVGQLLARLEKEGLQRNTVVVLSSDHGQCLFRSKQFLYDGGLHIPLIVRFPDGAYAGTVRSDLISGVDIAPTLLGFAGIELPQRSTAGRDVFARGLSPRDHIFAARDRMDTSIDRMRAVRTGEYKYIRNYAPGTPYMQSNEYKEKNYPTWNLVKQLKLEGKLNREQALFAAAEKPIEELYYLPADPDEVHNLASDPAHAKALEDLRALVDEYVERYDLSALYEDPIDIYRGYHGHLPEAPKTSPVA